GAPANYSQTFTFNITAADTTPGLGTAYGNLQLEALKAGNNSSSSSVSTTVYVKNSSGTTMANFGFSSFSSMTSNGDGTYSPASVGCNLPIGTYTVQITLGGNVADKNSVYYSLVGNWPLAAEANTDGVMYSLAGGLRIKNISNFSADGQLATSVDYLYHFQADSNHNGISEFYSTGKLLERPSYIDASWGGNPVPLYIKSESNATLRIGYDSVITQQKMIRHKDVFHNTNYRPNVYKSYYTGPRTEMMPAGLGNFPGRPGPDGTGLIFADIYFDYKPEGTKDFQDNANGKLEQSVDYVYDSVTGQYKVIREIDNSYTGTGTGIGGVIWGDRLYAAPNGVQEQCFPGLPIIYGVTNFFYPAMRSEAILPIQNIKKEYSIADSIVTVTSYLYNKENQLRRTTVTNSKDHSDIRETYYPSDYQGASGVVQEMANRHMLDMPIEQISKVDSLTVSGAYNLYQLHDNMVTPSQLYTLNTNAPVSLNLSAPTNVLDSRYKPRVNFSFDA